LGCASPLDKSRGGTPEGARALQGARRNASCGGYGTASFGVPLPFFLFVARMERSAIRNRHSSFQVVPGFRSAASGLLRLASLSCGRDRDGSRNHRRPHPTRSGSQAFLLGAGIARVRRRAARTGFALSLRAKRSNPAHDSRCRILDCFVASAPRNDAPLPACGERVRVRGPLRDSERGSDSDSDGNISAMRKQLKRPLIPTFSPRAGRGSG